MPFTFSHPALVIPLLRARRRWPWLSATGLITGSLAPDFEKFFRLHLASSHSHTLASLLYFSLPVSVALAFVFHLVVRRPLLAHLPAGLQRRVGRYAGLDWPAHFRHHYPGVGLSILLGAAGHLCWDIFTHPNAMTHRLPGTAVVVHLGGRAFSVYQISGVLNSVLGAVAIAWCVWRMPQQLGAWAPSRTSKPGYWALVFLITGALLVQWLHTVSSRWIDFGITAISAFMVGLLVASVWFRSAVQPPGVR